MGYAVNPQNAQQDMSAVAVVWDLKHAASYLNWWNRRPQRALALIEQLHDWQPKPDVTPEQETTLRSMIHMVTADSYLALKRFAEAADWYRRASEYSQVTGFAIIYADLVLTQKFREHYEPAYAAAAVTRSAWLDRPLTQRIYLRIVSPWWLDLKHWRLTLNEGRIIQQLKERIDAETTRSS
ncbi:MAG: hypothetical protein AAGF84_13130 [Planctomycetota bacterium]